MTAAPALGASDWTPLDQELRLWAADGLTLPLWWRDDDAVAMTPALDQLCALSDRLGLPVHLAIIPARVDPALAAELAPNCLPVVHGWSHRSHAAAGQKKSEYPNARSLPEMAREVETSLETVRDLFADRLVPMFVPPWNRITPDLMPHLAKAGYQAVSTFKPRTAHEAAPGLLQVNTHLDPINWRGDRSLVPAEDLIEQVRTSLENRRTGTTDATEPFGILTHHLVHDPAIWSFTEALIARLLDGPAAVWQFPTLQPPTKIQLPPN